MLQIFLPFLLDIVQTKSSFQDRRRLPRLLKGGGGGGSGGAVSVDPNNFVIPDGHVFHIDPKWPPQYDYSIS